MKGGLKSFVRSISPFAKSSSSSTNKQTSKSNSNQPTNNNDYDYASYSWDLSEVDLKISLKHFYRKFNPEKAYVVNEILTKYEGEETQLLQQLCQRYKLTQNDMQEYLDMSNQHDGSSLGSVGTGGKGNGTAAKKVTRSSSFSTLSSRQRSDDGSQVGSPQQAAPDKKTKKGRDRDDGSVTSASSNYHRFDWDLSNVDVGKALTTVYKRYNPTKAPNLNAIKNKSDSEIVSLLRQLCKRHGLSEEEMQDVLDHSLYDTMDEAENSFKKTGNNSSANDTIRGTGGRASYLQANNARSSINTPAGGKSAEIFSKLKSNNDHIPQFDDDFDNMQSRDLHSSGYDDHNQDDYQDDEDVYHQQQYQMNQAFNAKQMLSGPMGRRGSAPPYRPPSVPPQNQQAMMFQGQTADQNRSNVGPRQRVPFQNTEEDDNWTQEDDYPHYSNVFSNTGESLPPPPPPSQPTQLEIDQSLEIEALQKELDEVRQQAVQMSKDNQELTKLLKEAKQEIKTKFLKSAVPTASKSVQADDLVTAAELQRLKAQLNAQEERSKKLEEDDAKRNQKFIKLEKNVELLQRKLKALQADKTDLLQLINILSTAPIASKNVLESYLAKIASESPKGAGLTDRIMDKSMTMGDRIDELLQWKREKDLKEGGGSDGGDTFDKLHSFEDGEDGAGSSEDERYLIRGDDEDDHADYSSSYHQHRGKKVVPDTDELEALLMNPGEKKIYEQLMLNKKKNTVSNSSVASSNRSLSSRDPSPSVKSFSSKDITTAEKTDILAEQYELAKKYFEHQRSQAKLSEQMAKTNLNLQEMETDKVVRSTQQPRSNHHSRSASPNPMQRLNASTNAVPTSNNATSSSAKPNQTPTTSGGSQTNPNGESEESAAAATPAPINDWVECYDPKSKRKYYFSAALKKSTWTKPPEMKSDSSDETKVEPTKDKAQEDESKLSATVTEIPASRSASPAVSSRSTTPSNATRATVASSKARATSANSAEATASDPSQVWVTAIDPKTNRKFWYNRETKVSTWRKPADLI